MSSIPELLRQATHCHHTGALAQAEAIYRQVIEIEPGNADVYHLLGVLIHQMGRTRDGQLLLRQAVAIKPEAADIHYNLGITLLSTGNITEAGSCFQRVVLLDPGHVGAQINLGNTFLHQAQPERASACYQQVLLLNPRHAFAHFSLGCAYRDQGLLDEAIQSYREALSIEPGNSYAHYDLGLLLAQRGQIDEAADCFRQTLHFEPLHADALVNLGMVLRVQGNVLEAIQCFQDVLRRHPDHADLYNFLGICHIDLGQHAEATEYFQDAVRINPIHPFAWCNLGNALVGRGKLLEASQSFEAALAVEPESKLALYNRALLRLRERDFARGWPGFEQRWAQAGVVPRSFEKPGWDGSPLAGKTIFVYAEQGFGDTFQFVRYIPFVKARGGRVVFECPPALYRLLSSFKDIDELIVAGATVPSFDVQIALMSLPGVLSPTLTTIPAEVPYLRPAPRLVEDWGQALTALRGLRVGIAWQGNPKMPGDRFRSIPLKHFECLADVNGVCLVSLQKKNEQLTSWSGRTLIVDLSKGLVDFADTAAVMRNLDLVISSCTSICHLAGALGVPVWTALQFVPDWRWQTDRLDSPWYPTMRLFRQPRPGDWESVFEQMAQALALLCQGAGH